jgi:hypothetical protein
VWYAVLTERLQADAQFEDFAAATVDVAGEIYGVFSNEQRAIAYGWEQVGLPAPMVPTPQFTHPSGPAPVPAWVSRERPYRCQAARTVSRCSKSSRRNTCTSVSSRREAS